MSFSAAEIEEIRVQFDQVSFLLCEKDGDHLIAVQFDADRNGHITAGEIKNVLKALGEDTPGYKIRDMIREVDIDENGTVEFDEFIKVLVYHLNVACHTGL